jgi:hypothetical protein
MKAQKVSKNPSDEKNNLKVYGGIIGVALLVIASSIMLGRSDKGGIDVSATISNSNAAARASVKEGDPIPKDISNTNTAIPNGGLVGMGKPERPAPPPPTEETGTSTEDGIAPGEEAVEADPDAEDTGEPADGEAVSSDTPAETPPQESADNAATE